MAKQISEYILIKEYPHVLLKIVYSDFVNNSHPLLTLIKSFSGIFLPDLRKVSSPALSSLTTFPGKNVETRRIF